MTGYTNEWMNKVGNGRNMQVLRLASSGFQILPFWNISFSFFSEGRKTKRYRSIFRTPGPLLYKCVQAAGLDKAKSSIWVSYTYNRNLSPGAITCCSQGACEQEAAGKVELGFKSRHTKIECGHPKWHHIAIPNTCHWTIYNEMKRSVYPSAHLFSNQNLWETKSNVLKTSEKVRGSTP